MENQHRGNGSRTAIILPGSKERRRHVRKHRIVTNAAANGIVMKDSVIYNAAVVIAANSSDATECRMLLECAGLK